ncbi:MAG: hypothetical protein IKP10_06505 [Clostridia bacterium]|nr:hypothetical protein [Clostridia bacterium]
MDLQHEVAFAYLEEDKVQNAYFRVLPLVTRSGDIREEAREAWPDDGALRIIPDRNEQFTFKDRMRALGSWCAVDLTPYSPEANKIRTNKNYRPDRGESNRYIIFSDGICGPERAPFMELLEGKAEEAPQLAAQAITPVFCIRDGDTVYGPVDRTNPVTPGPSEPREARLFRMTLPDGREHALLCTEAEEEKPAEQESLPIGQALNILDQSKTFEETVESLSQPLSGEANLIHSRVSSLRAAMQENAPQKKLTGTPLIRTNVHTATPMVKDRVQEVVSGRFQAARNAEPPAPPVPFRQDLPQVENPVARAEQVLQHVWTDGEARMRLAQFLLSLDGMKQALDASQESSNSRLASAMQKHLENLEVERLRVLIELDQAREDMVAFREKAVAEATGRMRRELDSLRHEQDELRRKIAELRAEAGMAPEDGAALTGAELLANAERSFAEAGLPFHRENACVWLALVTRPGRIGVVSGDAEGSLILCENHARLLGWPFGTLITREDGEEAAPDTCGEPKLCLTFDPRKQCTGEVRLLCVVQDRSVFASDTTPVVPVSSMRYRIPELPLGTPVTADTLRRIVESAPLSASELREILRPVFAEAGMEDDLLEEAVAFAVPAAGLMDGGPVAACDWALCLYLAPRLTPPRLDAMRRTLSEYPRCAALIGSAL